MLLNVRSRLRNLMTNDQLATAASENAMAKTEAEMMMIWNLRLAAASASRSSVWSAAVRAG